MAAFSFMFKKIFYRLFLPTCNRESAINPKSSYSTMEYKASKFSFIPTFTKLLNNGLLGLESSSIPTIALSLLHHHDVTTAAMFFFLMSSHTCLVAFSSSSEGRVRSRIPSCAVWLGNALHR